MHFQKLKTKLRDFRRVCVGLGCGFSVLEEFALIDVLILVHHIDLKMAINT